MTTYGQDRENLNFLSHKAAMISPKTVGKQEEIHFPTMLDTVQIIHVFHPKQSYIPVNALTSVALDRYSCN